MPSAGSSAREPHGKGHDAGQAPNVPGGHEHADRHRVEPRLIAYLPHRGDRVRRPGDPRAASVIASQRHDLTAHPLERFHECFRSTAHPAAQARLPPLAGEGRGRRGRACCTRSAPGHRGRPRFGARAPVRSGCRDPQRLISVVRPANRPGLRDESRGSRRTVYGPPGERRRSARRARVDGVCGRHPQGNRAGGPSRSLRGLAERVRGGPRCAGPCRNGLTPAGDSSSRDRGCSCRARQGGSTGRRTGWRGGAGGMGAFPSR